MSAATAPRNGSSGSSTVWARFRIHSAIFVVVCFGVILEGQTFVRPTYQATTLLSIDGPDLRTEWDLLAEETREVDWEEQITSRAVLEPALRRLGEAASGQPEWERRLAAFRRRLVVERVRHSGVLRIAVADPDPAHAAAAANAVAQAFLAFRRDQAVRRDTELLHALDGSLGLLRAELEALAGLSHDFRMDEAARQELGRAIAAASAKLTQVSIRYQDGNPLVEQARQEKAAIEQTLGAWRQGRRAAFKARLAEDQTLRAALSDEPDLGTVEVMALHAGQRYQELLQQRAKTAFALTLRSESPDAAESLSVLERAAPPMPHSPLRRWALVGATMLLAGALGWLGVPLLLLAAERQLAALRSWLAASERSGSFRGPTPHPELDDAAAAAAYPFPDEPEGFLKRSGSA